MRIEEGEGLNRNVVAESTSENPADLATLTKLFFYHWHVETYDVKLADQIAGVIDTLAERFGYTLDEIAAPFMDGTYLPEVN
jgi:hypothetical protein